MLGKLGFCFHDYSAVYCVCKQYVTFHIREGRIHLFVHYTDLSLSSLCKIAWRHWTCQMLVLYILSSVCLRYRITFLWKRKCHFEEIFVTGCTRSCLFENVGCSPYRKFVKMSSLFQCIVSILYYNLPASHLFCFVFPDVVEWQGYGPKHNWREYRGIAETERLSVQRWPGGHQLSEDRRRDHALPYKINTLINSVRMMLKWWWSGARFMFLL